MKRLDEIVQIYNPMTKKYVKVDRVNALIIKCKQTKGPFKGIQIIHKKHEKSNS